MTHGDLTAILEAGDVGACIAYFEHATEDERKAVAALAFDWYAAQEYAGSASGDGPRLWGTSPSFGAASAAVLAACSFSQLKKRGRNLRPGDVDFRILEARKPDWTTDFAAWSLNQVPAIWPAVRKLERAGLCRRPETDHYVLGMIQFLAPRHGNPDIRQALLDDPELLAREVWKLFEVEGGGEFSLAARDKFASASATWEAGLVALAAEGALPRDRLLDASLGTLDRDFAQFRAGWFSRFHEALQPTLEERAERAERYLNLIASKIPPTVSFALGALSKLDRARRLPTGPLVEQIGPALTARSKGTVSSALKLLRNAASRDPALKPRVALIAAGALTHESPDAQDEAFELVVRCADRRDEVLATLLRSQVDRIAASVQPRVREWLGSPVPGDPPSSPLAAPPQAELEALLARAASIAPRFRELAGIDAAAAALRDSHCEVAALGFDGTELPRLDPEAAIAPIADLDELIDVFAAVLEKPDATDDVERVLDGVSRLCADRPGNFDVHTRPLHKRATALLERGAAGDHFGPFLGWHLQLDLCGLALSWTGGEAIDPDAAPRFQKEFGTRRATMCDYKKPVGTWSGTARVNEHSAELLFLSRRMLAVARRAAAGQAQPLLSAPTHRGGWIDPIVLVERIEQSRRAARSGDVHDQVLAILRLAPDRRAEARLRMGDTVSELAQAVRYALGEGSVAIGPATALWVAAARAREPFTDDRAVLAAHPNLGPDAGAAASFAYRIQQKPAGGGKTSAHFILDRKPTVPPDVPSELPTVRLHCHRHQRDPATIRWGATLWPIAREAWLAQGVHAIANNLDWWEARWSDRAYLEPLTDPDVPLKPMALMVLTLGLAARQADVQGLATDGLIAAIDDGRIDGPRLGGVLRSLLPTALSRPARWTKALRDAARVSPLHARTVAHALQHALGDGYVEAARDMLSLLELLRELLVEVGEPVSLPQMRAWLAGRNASGKTAKVVKDLLALAESGNPAVRRAAALRALAQRIERAERWSRTAC
jgi:hypothetical protein